MIFYRLALQRIIDYLNLDQLFKHEEPRHKKQKAYKTQLQTDRRMNLFISTLLSVLTWLVCLSIPFAALESPCESLKEHNLYTLYKIAKWLERYRATIDKLIVILFLTLVYVTVKTVVVAIKKTDLTVSPWIERGKYSPPCRRRRKKPFFWL
ncbi:hypothetical protein O3G_MSEX002880 [Manduca sexta]|uniref:Uncharacterized protein n=1 Tax=Manduca sexta TaxID=7130 RepID=A0A922CE51_MANSE|nr:hypothetical protein O3G_MSEX002880 [Manduca sexta]